MRCQKRCHRANNDQSNINRQETRPEIWKGSVECNREKHEARHQRGDHANSCCDAVIHFLENVRKPAVPRDWRKLREHRIRGVCWADLLAIVFLFKMLKQRSATRRILTIRKISVWCGIQKFLSSWIVVHGKFSEWGTHTIKAR